MLGNALLAVLPFLLATAVCGRRHDGYQTPGSAGDGVSVTDLKAGYRHTVARYAGWAIRNPDAVYGQLKLVSTSDAPPLPAVVRRRGTVVPLHAVGGYPKMLGETYNAEVSIGTPAQRFNLTADTGSTLTWAVLASCKDTECPGASGKHRYDPKMSSTSRVARKVHEAYGDGEMDVTLFHDVVELDALHIQGAMVGGASKTFERDAKLDHDGLLGLGRELSTQTEPVLARLAKHKADFAGTIALSLGAEPSLEVGGFDFVKYPKLKRYPVSGDAGWMLVGSSVRVEGATEVDAVNLLLDTGSSVSMLPVSRMDAIMNRAGLKVQRSKEEPIIYSMPCETKLGVQLVLPDGTLVAVKDSDILMKSNDPDMPGCLSLLVGTTNPFVPNVAGTPLLKSLYTVLSRTAHGDWIGLAPL